jgi:transposase
MRHRHELTDEQWARVAPLLPPQKPATGRPARDHRPMRNAMLWLHATGTQWRDLPERYGPWQRVATRFYRWVARARPARLDDRPTRSSGGVGGADAPFWRGL